MKNEHSKISITSLDAAVPDMSTWKVSRLVRHYKRTRSLRNEEAVFDELLARGKTRQEINGLLTN